MKGIWFSCLAIFLVTALMLPATAYADKPDVRANATGVEIVKKIGVRGVPLMGPPSRGPKPDAATGILGEEVSGTCYAIIIGISDYPGPDHILEGGYDLSYDDDDVAGHAANVSSIVPNDEYFDKQWALTKIQAPEAWQITSGNQDILIAVLDTGIDSQHEDLADKVVANVNLTDSPTTDDRYGHGTHIAGIIAANANNSFGIAGMSPNCRLLNVKVADDDGRGNSSVVARGIVWAVDNGAKVINMSLTINEPTQALEDAVNYAWNQGVVVIAASGNYVGNRPMYPACYSNCIAVGATDVNDSPTLGSGYNDWVDVVAPGVNIYSTLPDSKYGIESGTSMATAYVSGLAGLLFTLVTDTNGNGRLNDEVRDMIETNCNEIGTLDVSKRRVNALRAVGQALSLCPQSKL